MKFNKILVYYNVIYIDITISAALTLFIGVTFPFFGDLLGFFGGFGFASTSYIVSPEKIFSPLNLGIMY